MKRMVALFLVLLLSINSFAAVVSDNDGSAFITKAEFDSLKNDFQSQIDQYNTSIDAKIDGAIASYLAGINISKTETKNLLTYNWGSYTIKNGSLANEYKMPDLDLQISLMLTHEDNQGSTTTGYKKVLWGLGFLKYSPSKSRTNRRVIVEGLTLSGTSTISGTPIWRGLAANYVELFSAAQIRKSDQGLNPAYMQDSQTGNANKIWVCQALQLHGVGEITSSNVQNVWTPTFGWAYKSNGGTTTSPDTMTAWNPSYEVASFTTRASYMNDNANKTWLYEHFGTWLYNTSWTVTAYAQDSYINTTTADTYKSDNHLSSSTSNGSWSGNEWHATNGYAAFKKNQSFGWRDNKNDSLSGSTNKSTIPHIGIVPTSYISQDIYQYGDDKIIDGDGTAVPKITLEQGMPLMKVKEDETIEWEPVFSSSTVPGTTGNVECVVVLSYKPFTNGSMTYYEPGTQDLNDYVKIDGFERGIFPITTDGKLKIKFESEHNGYIYAKWFPNVSDSDISSKAWEATLDIASCKQYKSTKG